MGDDTAALLREVLEEYPAEEQGHREEWGQHVGWHRKEDIHAVSGVQEEEEKEPISSEERREEEKIRQHIHEELVDLDLGENPAADLPPSNGPKPDESTTRADRLDEIPRGPEWLIGADESTRSPRHFLRGTSVLLPRSQASSQEGLSSLIPLLAGL